MMIAGSTAFVTGVATAAVGLLASPALAAATLSYQCTGTTDTNQTAVDVTLSATVTGSVTGTPNVGDAVSLDNFQATFSGTDPALVTAGVDHITGSVAALGVTPVAGDGTAGNPVSPTGLSIDTQVDGTGALSFALPAAPQSLTGFTATAPGAMTFSMGDFSADLTLLNSAATDPVDTVTVTCTGGGQIASVDVPKPPDNGGGDNGGTSNQGGDHGGNNGGNGNGGATGGAGGGSTTPPPHNSPAPNHNTNTNTNTGTQNAPQARGTLANTGVPYTIPMTATGAALLLAGAVMLVAVRRRRRAAANGALTED